MVAGKRKRNSKPGGSPEKKTKLSSTNEGQKKVRSRPFSGAAVSVDDGDATPFPRGGQDSLTPLEKRVIHQQVKQDILFNENNEQGGEGKKPSKKRPKTGDGDSTHGKRSKILNIMNAKKLLPGALILGAVLEVHEFEVIVSLPFNMRGTVAASEVSDQLTQRLQSEAERLELEEDEEQSAPTSSSTPPPLSSLFVRGQLLQCYVVSVEGGRVSLSLNPRLVNTHLTPTDVKPGMILPGVVKSIEDHGYIIDFNVKGKTGFLLKKNTAEFLKERGKSLHLGQVMGCLVLPGADARAVPVSVNPSQVGGALLPGDTLVGLNALLPGALVNSAVKEVGSNGLLMSFLGGFEGTVSIRHLQTLGDLSTENYHIKKKFKARILWVDVATKTAGLTLQRQIVSGSSYCFEGLEVGDSFAAAKVTHVDHSRGLYLELGNDIIGYAPAWMLTDEKEKSPNELTKSTHRVGTIHPCRIVQFNLLDGCPIVSLQLSIIEKPYMRYSDLAVGEMVEGKVERFGDFGMIIGITDTIRGLCIRTHLSDTRAIMKQPRKKYKEGSKVKARVLSVDPPQNRLLLTCKKSLVRSTSEPLTSYTQTKPGDLRQGVITSIREFGCLVTFFNGIRGLVLKSELGLDRFVPDLSTVFWAGQPVECRVLECDPDKRRLMLSLRADCAAHSVAEDKLVKIGSFVSAEVTGIASNGINLKCVKSDEGLFLPTQHLSDYMFHCAHLLSMHQTALEKSVKKGKAYVLDDLLVLSERAGYKPAQVTLKKELHRHSRETVFVSEFSELKVDTVQPGVVKKLMPYGCFIEFPHHLSGLAPTKYLTNEFVSGPAGLYQEMQTVWCKVMQIDEANGKILLSLRPSDIRPSLEEGLAGRLLVSLRDFVSERDAILKDLAKSSQRSPVSALAKSFVPGSSVLGHVTLVGDYVTVDLGDGVMGKASAQTASVSLTAGDEVTAIVLDIDLVECCLVLSLNQQLLPSRNNSTRVLRSASKRKSVSQPTTEEPLDSQEAVVEHKTAYYCVLSYSNGAGAKLAYGAMNTGQLGVLPLYFKDLKIGQKVSTTTIQRAGKDDSFSLPVLLMEEPSAVKDSDTQERRTLYNIKPGDIVTVKAHSVKPTQLDVRYHTQKGRIHATLCENAELDCSDDVTMTSSQRGVVRNMNVGDQLQARVIKVKARQITGLASRKGATLDVLELTTKPSLMDPSVELDADGLLKKSYSVGEEAIAVITQIKDTGLQVSLNPRAEGFVPAMLTSEDPTRLGNLKMHYTRGQAVRCTVLGCESGKNHLHQLSMIGKPEPCEGNVVLGHINKVVPGQALLVSTPYGNGRVDITNIADSYTEDPLNTISAKNGIVRCCLVSMDDGKLDFSMRVSRTGLGEELSGGDKNSEVDPEIESIADLSKDQVVRGYIKAVTDVGVFVRLGRNVDGRVKITHLTDGFIKNFKKHFTVGKLVKAKVLSVDGAHGKVDLSLRLSHVDPEAAKKERKKQEKRKNEGVKKTTSRVSTSDGESVELESVASSSDEEVGVASDTDESENEPMSSDEDEVRGQPLPATSKPTLKIEGGFRWDVGVVNDARGGASSSDSEEEKEPAPKKTRRQKKAAQKAEEELLYKTEQALLTEKKEPETPDDFDRLLLATPNDSALWVKYMSFYLHTTEVDKARTVAQRALKTIEFREKEKLNVWVAWMNLENLYGAQESLVKVFESALQENEPFKVFTRLVGIYQQSEKFDLAEQLYQSMTKRFSSTPQVWTQYGEFLMKRGKKQAARALLQRSLKSLTSKPDHVQMIRKFAQFEFKYGEPERGKTMFESLLSTYPRRIDVWSEYIDHMIKLGDSRPVRSLFERVVHLNVSAKKMKFLFKRYLEFEQKYGTTARVEEVKLKAKEYVEARTRQKV